MLPSTFELLAVCIGKSQPYPNKTGATGIDKKPLTGPVTIGPLGLVGDDVADQVNHGGPDQAVYLYTQADYDAWAAELGDKFTPGLFGENLLISGPESANIAIGQRFRIGDVVLEATAARIPCETFAGHVGDPKFVKKFREARRPGIYARVIQTGTVQVGDTVTLSNSPANDAPTILDTFEFVYAKQPTPAQIERLLGAPVSVRMREMLEEKLGR